MLAVTITTADEKVLQCLDASDLNKIALGRSDWRLGCDGFTRGAEVWRRCRLGCQTESQGITLLRSDRDFIAMLHAYLSRETDIEPESMRWHECDDQILGRRESCDLNVCTHVHEQYNSVCITPYSVQPVLRRTWDIRSMRPKLITVILLEVLYGCIYSIDDIFSLLYVIHLAPVNLGPAHVGRGKAHSKDA